MTKEEMVNLLSTDPDGWNAWREQSKIVHPDLSYAVFFMRDLRGVNLDDAILAHADFRDSSLQDASFMRAILIGSNFEGANLTGASLKHADLEKADFDEAVLLRTNLQGASLHKVNFVAADLKDANFTDAALAGTFLVDVDLSVAKGLEAVHHGGPSTVSIETLYRSQGAIPEHFLRDAGVPEEFIRFIPSFVNARQGIQFYSCFISYSHRDEEFAQALFSKMRDARLRVWYAPEDMKGGQKIHEQVETAIRVYDKLLVVLSESSLASEWVKTEIRNARRQERKTGKRKLFPVRLVPFGTIAEWSEFDADSGKDLGVEVREYFIPDFTRWKEHDRFQTSFERLLRDLKADGPASPEH